MSQLFLPSSFASLPLPPTARYLTRLRETRRPARAIDNPNYISLGGI